ncbi:MAG: hypothetical protein R3C56_12295 [Pirellulaceae bacterium]
MATLVLAEHVAERGRFTERRVTVAASVQPAVVVAAAARANCGGCGSPVESMAAGSGGPAFAPAVQTVSRRVWVPNVVTENVPVVENQSKTEVISYTAFETQTEQVPYECTYVVYVPEQRTGTRQAVDYVNETRTRNRKVVQYSEETRSRTHRELSYTTQTRTETIPFVTYSTEKRTKEVTYQINVPQTKTEPFTTTRFDTVVEDVTEEYTVRVPVLTSKEVQVQVCRMVPKLVPVTIYPCSGSAGNSCCLGCWYRWLCCLRWNANFGTCDWQRLRVVRAVMFAADCTC